jgi:molybdopterin converting factor small subunit
MYMIGLMAQCSSVLQMSKLARKDELLKPLFQYWNIAYAKPVFNNRFPVASIWTEAVIRLQQDADTALQDGDVVDLDDSVWIIRMAKSFLSFAGSMIRLRKSVFGV